MEPSARTVFVLLENFPLLVINYTYTMNVNARYKDSVFSLLFSDPDLLRELYCALDDVSLPPDVPVTFNTLENVLFMELINDISFEIGGKLVVLIEHQSSINANMPLRLLMYIARVYEKTEQCDSAALQEAGGIQRVHSEGAGL